MSSDDKKKNQRWFPLESNPDLMNEYVKKLGFDTSLAYEFVDVFSTEEWALEMIPQPVAAVIMLYPLTDKQLGYQKPPVGDGGGDEEGDKDKDKIWFIKQRIGNACGTIGLLHALMNVPGEVGEMSVKGGSWLDEFRQKCPVGMDPIAKAEILESDDDVAAMHDSATSDATLNQTDRGRIDDKVITHFVALVRSKEDSGGKCSVYELDGRREGPVRHAKAGSTTSQTFLKDCTEVVKRYMERDPTEVRFTILALAPKQN